jgi:hypothetical protein
MATVRPQMALVWGPVAHPSSKTFELLGVREAGLEPARLAALDPKSSASAVPPLSRPEKHTGNSRVFEG